MKKKLLKILLSALGLLIVWNHIPYYYNNDKVVAYITNHAGAKSKNSCAGPVAWRMPCQPGGAARLRVCEDTAADGV